MVERVTANTDKNTESDKEDPEYVQKMVDRAEGKSSPSGDDIPSMPENGFEKFYNEKTGDYNWEAHAKDAEYRLQQSKRDKSQDADEGDDSDDGDKSDADKNESDDNEDKAREALEDKGLNFDAYAQEFAETGELSEKSYEELEKSGIPKEIVDDYIEGQRVRADSLRNDIFEMTGGEDGYMDMVEWAKANLSAEEISAYNKALDTNEQASVKMAVEGMYAKYANAEGLEPTLMRSGVNRATKGSVFRSWEEVTKAMGDERYGTDPAYTKEIEQKVARSDLKAGA